MDNLRENIHLDREEIKDGAPFAALSYVFFLWILTFIFKNDNRFAHFHARQGIVIFMGEVICMFFLIVPVLGAIFSRLGLFVLFCLSFYGIYTSLTGRVKHIHFVTDIAEKFVV